MTAAQIPLRHFPPRLKPPACRSRNSRYRPLAGAGEATMRVQLVLSLFMALCGSAGAFSEGDRAAVEGAIETQLKAFLADDAATAYSFAAPGIRAVFTTEDVFMQMVKQLYPQVYRPRSYAFAELTEKGRGLEQMVDIVDSEGVYWTAVYTLEMQPDGSWKITGCYLLKKPGEVA
jgi:Domain of unknown function (DUF4864)